MFENVGLSYEERQQAETLYAEFPTGLQPALDELFADLNREQVAALSHPHSAGKPLLILAGAGSGKTAVLTRRVALLLLAGIPADRVFVSTFTVKAAGEMKERIGKLITKLMQTAEPTLRARLDDLLRGFAKGWIGTFHSLCLRLLREKNADGFTPAEELGFPPTIRVLSDGEARKILKEIVEALPVKPDYRSLTAAIDLAANDLLTPEALAPKKIYAGMDAAVVADAWMKYQQAKHAQGAVDFTDLLYLVATAFADGRICSNAWRKRFSHVLIDEYQDTNIAQYAIATELGAADRNIFVVGDDDQSIYRFRGADIRNIRAFTQDYADARVIRLIRNYRSTPIILGAANAVLAARPDSETDKTLLASAPEDSIKPEKIIVYEAQDHVDEMNFLAFQVQEFLKEGFQYKDIVIFYRVHELADTVTTTLREAKIPFAEVGGRALLDNAAVKIVLELLKSVEMLYLRRHGRFDGIRHADVLAGALRNLWTYGKLGPKNLEDRKFLLNLPSPHAILLDENAYVQAVHAAAGGETQEHLEKLWSGLHGAAQGIESVNPAELIAFLTQSFGLDAMAGDDFDIRQGMVLLHRFLTSRLPYAPAGEEGLHLMLDALDSSSKGTETVADITQENAVRLLTIHAAKGLEFPVVFVVGVEEDILPFVHPGEAKKETENERYEREEEELRLFYVAITRAKKRLVLTCAAQRPWYGKDVTHRPSRYLARLPAELVIRGSALSSADRATHRVRQFFKDLFGA